MHHFPNWTTFPYAKFSEFLKEREVDTCQMSGERADLVATWFTLSARYCLQTTEVNEATTSSTRWGNSIVAPLRGSAYIRLRATAKPKVAC